MRRGKKDKKKEKKPEPRKYNIHEVGAKLDQLYQEFAQFEQQVFGKIDNIGYLLSDLWRLGMAGVKPMADILAEREEEDKIQREAEQRAMQRIDALRKEGKPFNPDNYHNMVQEEVGKIKRAKAEAAKPKPQPKPAPKSQTIHEAVAKLPKTGSQGNPRRSIGKTVDLEKKKR